ncbi:MAG: hypothetical protein SGPRY_008524, partial [Prymnesium sp.]
MEAAGWHLLSPLRTLWRVVSEGGDVCASLDLATSDHDTNSATNVDAEDHTDVVHMGGRDSLGAVFASPEEFWLHELCGDSTSWYQRSGEFWQKEAATVHGMMGGLDQLHALDVKSSAAFLERLRALSTPLTKGVALDCGAGIGRISASLLLNHFAGVELLEPVASFVAKAMESLPEERVHAAYVERLERFTPAAGKAYSCVWVQWVLNYLTDDDLILFLHRCASALEPGGAIVVKESCSRPHNDRSDASITRTAAHFRRCFDSAHLEVVAEQGQTSLPREVFP